MNTDRSKGSPPTPQTNPDTDKKGGDKLIDGLFEPDFTVHSDLAGIAPFPMKDRKVERSGK